MVTSSSAPESDSVVELEAGMVGLSMAVKSSALESGSVSELESARATAPSYRNCCRIEVWTLGGLWCIDAQVKHMLRFNVYVISDHIN